MLQPDVRSAALAARPEQPSGFIGCRNITLRLIILLSSEIKRFIGCVGASGSDLARNPLFREFPCYAI